MMRVCGSECQRRGLIFSRRTDDSGGFGGDVHAVESPFQRGFGHGAGDVADDGFWRIDGADDKITN